MKGPRTTAPASRPIRPVDAFAGIFIAEHAVQIPAGELSLLASALAHATEDAGCRETRCTGSGNRREMAGSTLFFLSDQVPYMTVQPTSNDGGTSICH
ncbi:hypothetical protein ACIA03_26340 [Nocardioides sp. NPDC051685]|uniref:hypothetical protein n=1 Tax=Nocardioides sp. NPDC051685 TaxID=3364334 RepID=UPI0037AB9900